MEYLGLKEIKDNDGTITIRLYALGNGILATEETQRQNSVSSYKTKNFTPTKKNVTIESNLKRAYKFYNFTEEDISNFKK